MRHAEIHAPFRPGKYAEAIVAGASQFPVVVVDSASHEWAGDGGCLDWHDDLMGGDQKKNLSAWIEPKKAHKQMVTRLLQVSAHVILCFRAEPKVEVTSGNRIVPKQSLTGLDGWIPIAEKNLPYELTASFLLMADKPGVPLPIKLNEQHRSIVPLDRPLSTETGKGLAAWAAGAGTPAGETTEAPTGVVSSGLASDAQRRAIADAAGAAGLSTAQAKAIVLEVTGQEKTAGIPADRVDAVLAAISFAGSVPA
jgi:hypothetical protein